MSETCELDHTSYHPSVPDQQRTQGVFGYPSMARWIPDRLTRAWVAGLTYPDDDDAAGDDHSARLHPVFAT
jgi:hypothetical protein